MKKTLVTTFFLLVMLCSLNAYAITNVGTTGAQFLKIGPDARAEGLGGAFGAVSNDVNAIYWNPAGLSHIQKNSLSNTYTVWLGDTRYNFLAFATPVEKVGTIAASVTALTMPQMEITTLENPDGTGLWFDAGDWAVSLAYARQLYDRSKTHGTEEGGARLSFGINTKLIYQKIYRESAKGVAVDVGTLYYTGWRSLRIGMCLSNFGPDMSFSGPDLKTGTQIGGTERFGEYNPFPDTTNPTRTATLDTTTFAMPINFRVGVAYDIVDQGDHFLTLALDGNHPNDNNERLHIGAEYWYKKAGSIRVGYKFRLGEKEIRKNEEENITLGLGLNLNVKTVNLILDYAFANFDLLEQAHHITLGIVF
ncbi:PorV/PorQ family protein [Candidatus Poribacteria bacterium]|nr:PorV/PorQ family protein [Candidatus Poribacteria bacterium]